MSLPLYKVIGSSNLVVLCEQVTNHVRDGWHCVGGLVVDDSGKSDAITYRQAVVWHPPLKSFLVNQVPAV